MSMKNHVIAALLLIHGSYGYHRLCADLWTGANYDGAHHQAWAEWQGSNFKGYDPNIHDGNGGRYGDDLESVLVHGGCWIRFYDHTDGDGSNWTLQGPKRVSLWTLGIANRISSWRCECSTWGGYCANGYMPPVHERTHENQCKGCNGGYVFQSSSGTCVKEACAKIRIINFTPLQTSSSIQMTRAAGSQITQTFNRCGSPTDTTFSWTASTTVKKIDTKTYTLANGWERQFSRGFSHTWTAEFSAEIKVVEVGGSYTYSTQQTATDKTTRQNTNTWTSTNEITNVWNRPITGIERGYMITTSIADSYTYGGRADFRATAQCLNTRGQVMETQTVTGVFAGSFSNHELRERETTYTPCAGRRCSDRYGWRSTWGETCGHLKLHSATCVGGYAYHRSPAGVMAKDACCHCGGGTWGRRRRVEDAPSPLPAPVAGDKTCFFQNGGDYQAVDECKVNSNGEVTNHVPMSKLKNAEGLVEVTAAPFSDDGCSSADGPAAATSLPINVCLPLSFGVLTDAKHAEAAYFQIDYCNAKDPTEDERDVMHVLFFHDSDCTEKLYAENLVAADVCVESELFAGDYTKASFSCPDYDAAVNLETVRDAVWALERTAAARSMPQKQLDLQAGLSCAPAPYVTGRAGYFGGEAPPSLAANCEFGCYQGECLTEPETAAIEYRDFATDCATPENCAAPVAPATPEQCTCTTDAEEARGIKDKNGDCQCEGRHCISAGKGNYLLFNHAVSQNAFHLKSQGDYVLYKSDDLTVVERRRGDDVEALRITGKAVCDWTVELYAESYMVGDMYIDGNLFMPPAFATRLSKCASVLGVYLVDDWVRMELEMASEGEDENGYPVVGDLMRLDVRGFDRIETKLMVPVSVVESLEDNSLCTADGSPAALEAARYACADDEQPGLFSVDGSTPCSRFQAEHPACSGPACVDNDVAFCENAVLADAVSSCAVLMQTFECAHAVEPERVPLINSLVESCIHDVCGAEDDPNANVPASVRIAAKYTTMTQRICGSLSPAKEYPEVPLTKAQDVPEVVDHTCPGPDAPKAPQLPWIKEGEEETPAPIVEEEGPEPEGVPFIINKYDKDDKYAQFMDDFEGVLDLLADIAGYKEDAEEAVKDPENRPYVIFLCLFIFFLLTTCCAGAYYYCKHRNDKGSEDVKNVELTASTNNNPTPGDGVKNVEHEV